MSWLRQVWKKALISTLVLLVITFMICWTSLPTWAPGFVINYSPLLDPAFRASLVIDTPEDRALWAERVHRLTPADIPLLLRYTNDRLPLITRKHAYAALVTINSPLLLDTMLSTMNSDDRDLATIGSKAFCLSNPASIPRLIEHMQNPQSPYRQASTMLISTWPDKAQAGKPPPSIHEAQVAPLMLTLMKDPDPVIRAIACGYFYNHIDLKYAEPVMALLNDPIAQVHIVAARVIGQFALDEAQQKKAEDLFNSRPQAKKEAPQVLLKP